jgi:glyoxylase-like metal-dependent hydrolase (beta-lactamase superfamily II)
VSVGVPPVDAIAPGVWSVLLPLTDSPVGSVFVYLLRHEGGLLLIDTGYDDEPSRAALAQALAVIGHDVSEITAIVLTHNHPDHVGMANRLHAHTGAPIALHHREWPRPGPGKGWTFGGRIATELALAGMPDEDVPDMVVRSSRAGAGVDSVQADRVLEDGAVIDEGGVRLEAIVTPGHADGHVCLLDRGRGLLFSGDVILPAGEVQLSIINGPAHDPVAELRASMRRISQLGVTAALPGHQRRIEDLPARVRGARNELDGRSAQVARAAAAKPGSTAWELVTEVDWGRPWPRMRRFARRFAVMQTFAHLRGLALQGDLDRELDGAAERYWGKAGAAAVQTG